MSKPEIPSLGVQDCMEMLRVHLKILLLDVRRPEEYAAGSIPGSMHLEQAEILAGKLVDLLPYKESGIVLQCHSGVRSMQTAKYLATQGFAKLWNMKGGIVAYRELVKAEEKG